MRRIKRTDYSLLWNDERAKVPEPAPVPVFTAPAQGIAIGEFRAHLRNINFTNVDFSRIEALINARLVAGVREAMAAEDGFEVVADVHDSVEMRPRPSLSRDALFSYNFGLSSEALSRTMRIPTGLMSAAAMSSAAAQMSISTASTRDALDALAMAFARLSSRPARPTARTLFLATESHTEPMWQLFMMDEDSPRDPRNRAERRKQKLKADVKQNNYYSNRFVHGKERAPASSLARSLIGKL